MLENGVLCCDAWYLQVYVNVGLRGVCTISDISDHLYDVLYFIVLVLFHIMMVYNCVINQTKNTLTSNRHANFASQLLQCLDTASFSE